MSLQIDKCEVKPIRTTYRVLCFFVCFFALIALFGSLVFGTQEHLAGGIAASLVPLALLYVGLPIVLFGYPPKILMWTLDKTESSPRPSQSKNGQ